MVQLIRLANEKEK